LSSHPIAQLTLLTTRNGSSHEFIQYTCIYSVNT